MRRCDVVAPVTRSRRRVTLIEHAAESVCERPPCISVMVIGQPRATGASVYKNRILLVNRPAV